MPLFFEFDPDDDLFQFNDTRPLDSLCDVISKSLTHAELSALRSVMDSPPESATALGEARPVRPSFPDRRITFYSAPALLIINWSEHLTEKVRRVRARLKE